MRIEIQKRTDGAVVLRCVRADGTVTWQRQEGRLAAFFPLHDLTHYAVETTLGCRAGFFGLVASGWDIADTGGKGARGPLPREAVGVEMVVGFLDAERASGARWTAAELNEKIALYYETRGTFAPAPPITDDDLARIRQLRGELFARWDAVPEGEALELTFG
jgi:hypothetical protein